MCLAQRPRGRYEASHAEHRRARRDPRDRPRRGVRRVQRRRQARELPGCDRSEATARPGRTRFDGGGAWPGARLRRRRNDRGHQLRTGWSPARVRFGGLALRERPSVAFVRADDGQPLGLVQPDDRRGQDAGGNARNEGRTGVAARSGAGTRSFAGERAGRSGNRRRERREITASGASSPLPR